MSTSKVATLLFLLKAFCILIEQWIHGHVKTVLILSILATILGLTLVYSTHPMRSCQQSSITRPTSRAFPVFDDFMPLPNPRPEDCIIVPLDNPSEKDIVDQRVLTTA